MHDRKLPEEIAYRLNYDILNYGWLLKIAREQFPGRTFEQQIDALVESLRMLVDELRIVIGPTILRDGLIHIENWGDSVDETIGEVRRFIDRYG